LSKADLIAKILEVTATTGQSTDATTITYPPSESASITTNEPKASEEKGEPKKKEGNVKKRKATDQPGPSSKSSQEGSAKGLDEATDTTQSQNTPPNPDPIPAPLLNGSAGSADAPAPTKTKNVKTKEPAPIKPKATKKTPAPISVIEPSSKLHTRIKPQVIPKPRSNPKPPLALKSQDIAQTQTDPKVPVSRKTPTAATKSKVRPSILTAQVARPRFTGLVSTKPVQASSPAPRPQDIEIDLSTFDARIEFIESHFLNTLFTLLHQYRAKSITSQFPCPPSFTNSTKYKLTSHLAFQGLHPDVYDTKDGFQVAIRFWIARMHSYMQLGSGEAWSGRAGGMGMLGPDLATWPPVLGVEKVTEEVWAVKTGEEIGEVRYLIMGEIGEVVARSKGITGDEVLVSGCVVRSDWAKYLGSRDRKSLESMVKTKESYYFPNGVAKGWAAKQSEGMVKIANRAVLASCALNR
jgi:hypothetical protein